MKHKFSPQLTNPKLCKECSRDYISHTYAARCESCGKQIECDVYPIDNLVDTSIENKLWCWPCKDVEVQLLIDRVTESANKNREIQDLARDVNENIRYDGDVFNAKTIALVELKQAYLNDESIPQEDRSLRYQEALGKQLTHFKEVLFQKQGEVHDIQVEMLVIKKSLRDFGNDLKKEIREQLRISDSTYVVAPPIKINVKPKAQPKSRLDKAIDAMLLLNPKLTREEAMKMIGE